MSERFVGMRKSTVRSVEALPRKREEYGHDRNQGRNSGRLRILVQDLHTRPHRKRIPRDRRGSVLPHFLYRARDSFSGTRVHILRGQAVGEQGRHGRNRLALEKHHGEADSEFRLFEWCESCGTRKRGSGDAFDSKRFNRIDKINSPIGIFALRTISALKKGGTMTVMRWRSFRAQRPGSGFRRHAQKEPRARVIRRKSRGFSAA